VCVMLPEPASPAVAPSDMNDVSWREALAGRASFFNFMNEAGSLVLFVNNDGSDFVELHVNSDFVVKILRTITGVVVCQEKN